MADSLAGVVLAAGGGTRLRPLTLLRPKPLCPVGNVALVDLALRRAGALTSSLAVNVHHGRALMEEHLARRVHLSVEEPEALGTAGAIGKLRDWIAGRPVVVVNADAWSLQPLGLLTDGWDGERIRLLVVDDAARPDFEGRWRYAGACVMPWSEAAALPDRPGGLYEHSWRAAAAGGRLELVPSPEVFFDCGTPADYLAANLAASGGSSVVGPGAVIEGQLEESVVWPGAIVRPGERLVRAIRASRHVTVLVR